MAVAAEAVAAAEAGGDGADGTLRPGAVRHGPGRADDFRTGPVRARAGATGTGGTGCGGAAEDYSGTTASASISISTSGRNSAETCIAELVGSGVSPKNSFRASRTAARCSMSVRK